jgi:hypothetical protein
MAMKALNLGGCCFFRGDYLVVFLDSGFFGRILEIAGCSQFG